MHLELANVMKIYSLSCLCPACHNMSEVITISKHFDQCRIKRPTPALLTLLLPTKHVHSHWHTAKLKLIRIYRRWVALPALYPLDPRVHSLKIPRRPSTWICVTKTVAICSNILTNAVTPHVAQANVVMTLWWRLLWWNLSNLKWGAVWNCFLPLINS